jgi:hypothetical protein
MSLWFLSLCVCMSLWYLHIISAGSGEAQQAQPTFFVSLCLCVSVCLYEYVPNLALGT